MSDPFDRQLGTVGAGRLFFAFLCTFGVGIVTGVVVTVACQAIF